ncbi:ribosome silencing factor [bacterium]|nr:MAG: ribosome silencing factor [bacterium]
MAQRVIEEETKDLLASIGEALLEKKAENILQLDVRGICSFTDFFVVCHATSDTQIKALSSNVVVKVTEDIGEKPVRKEGLDARRWATLDYGNVVVHIFLNELRSYYKLEKMWSDAHVTEITD